MAATCYLGMLLFFSALVLLGLKLNTQVHGQGYQKLSKPQNKATTLRSCRWQFCCDLLFISMSSALAFLM